MNSIVEVFAQGIEKSGIPPREIAVPSDIPFDPDVIRYLGVDFFHINRGRAIAFGTGLKLGNPSLKVVAFIGDLMTLGGNHFVHAGRRNMELLVICVNNFVYKKINGKSVPGESHAFSAYSTFEEPFNIPHLGNSCGAIYTARWTVRHTDELAQSISEAMHKRGLSMIEVLTPGPNYYVEIKNINAEMLDFYYENSIIKNNEDPRNVAITPEQPIIVGKFTDTERPTFVDSYNAQLSNILKDKFTPYGSDLSHKQSGGSDG
jgi:2-oxoglutarate ferredoxin oxidoreductase subunit beta